MSLKLERCEDRDMPRCFEVISLAFGDRQPHFNSIFPLHDTQEGRKAGAERLLSSLATEPNAHYFKVTDVDTGVIVGVAKWLVYKGKGVPEEIRVLPAGYYADREAQTYAEYMFNRFLVPRRKAIEQSGGNIVCLDLMMIDPAHQGRGAGSLLMRWGIGEADRLEVEAVVEATTEGRVLYEKFGYAVVDQVTISNPEKQAGNARQMYYWMRRPASVT